MLRFIRRLGVALLEPWRYANRWARKSYAQEGEDLVVDRLFDGHSRGFYVDIGAHHPFRFSNTFFFYRKGWKGICVDPLPGTLQIFNKYRPKDIFIQAGISMQATTLTYFMFNEPALNTFDAEIAKKRNGLSNNKIVDAIEVETVRLSSVLEANLGKNQKIDILSIDVEGLDLEVLKSNDWNKYKPECVIVECLKTNLENLLSDPVFLYLNSMEYEIYAKTGNSVIFVKRGMTTLKLTSATT
ncbi:FkbM family methyltransferase [Nevskia soli]|uniref:FkbM family methyltransferase n=1 Tax=Nevskia soli TaxID=418856 RepID=UPI000A03AE48|nr:FkbM family methyltransferase [Nevskia soli]